MAKPLAALFEHMLSHPLEYIGAGTGQQFEERISVHLNTLGYDRLLPSDIGDQFRDIKALVQAKTSRHCIPNPTLWSAHFVYHRITDSNTQTS